MTYDTTGKRRRTENLAGQATTTAWDCCHKVYADGKGPKYEYDVHGQLAKRTWARGIDTFYAYDSWGNLTNTTYSDTTPTITLAYDAMGRQTRAIDAAGTTTFAYDAFGANTNETVVGVAGTNTIERFTDAFGRDAGYALNGVRQSTLGYDPATGRIETMLAAGSEIPFSWNYVLGSDLKSSLAYPNGLTASWTYGSRGELLQVRNAFPTNVVSQFDDDGNQTLVKTATGIWQIVYNGENRPVRWGRIDQSEQSTNQAILAMSYDRIGRRVTKNDQRFVYNGYLQIAVNGGNAYVWDVMEPVATRPLAWRHDGATLFYTHDGNKNVSEVVSIDVFLADHYEYAPFGAVILRRGGFAAAAPWRFSSECFDDETEAIYYNFRHYVPWCGRWSRRDSAGEDFGPNLFGYIDNGGTGKTDVLGLFDDGGGQKVCVEHKLEIEVAYGGLSFQWVCVYWKRIKGHRDFENNGTVCPFDYTKEDYDWKSSPFAPWGIDRHFKERKDIVGGKGTSVSGHHSQDAKKSGVKPGENLLLAVIGKCDPNAFQSLMHQLQDTRVHNGNGFKAHNWSWKFPFYEPGHAWHGSGPDHNDESQKWRWNLAEEDTHYYVNLWKTKCQLKDACKCTWRKVGE